MLFGEHGRPITGSFRVKVDRHQAMDVPGNITCDSFVMSYFFADAIGSKNEGDFTVYQHLYFVPVSPHCNGVSCSFRICRTLLEVHQGDELWQVARWHCRRYSLGMGRVAGLSAKLEKVGRPGPLVHRFVAAADVVDGGGDGT